MRKSASIHPTPANNTGDDTKPAPEFQISEKDLPMSSNTEEVHVLHYLFSMQFKFPTKVMWGSAIIFVSINSTGESIDQGCLCPRTIVLDSCALNVSSVSYLRRLQLSDYEIQQRKFWLYPAEREANGSTGDRDWFKTVPLRKLNFEVSKWSVAIKDWCPCTHVDVKPAPTSNESQAATDEGLKVLHVIRIDYETLPETPSLHWRPASGYHYCSTDPNHTHVVYTPGALVNNRGLFPCQDAPAAFATWEALVHVQQPYQALLTSEQTGRRIQLSQEEGTAQVYYYYSTHSMPISTFAFIAGVFDEHTIVSDGEHSEFAPGLIPTRFLTLSQLQLSSFRTESSWNKIRQYTRNVLQAAHSVLGPHPYPKLDLVIMPSCFKSFGLASPHLIFLSPTNFYGDECNEGTRMLYHARIAHEISHSWFGLAIGAQDWNEVWLSEGFATFAEDVLYAEAMLAANPEDEESLRGQLESELEMKACFMLHTLRSEVGAGETENSQDKLRVLVPDSDTSDSKAVQNGLVPLRQFIQVHYLKGFFFLRHLCNLVGGLQHFLPFLKSYVEKFSGRLVTSQEFVHFFFTSFQLGLKELGIEEYDQFYEDWFYKAELPESLRLIQITQLILNSDSTQQQQEVIPKQELRPIDLNKCQFSLSRIRQAFKGVQEMPKCDMKHAVLNSYELILLFELILEDMNSEGDHQTAAWKPEEIMRCLDFVPEAQNPEVLHRWCEILLKAIIQSPGSQHNKSRLAFIANFLLQHPAVGLYLYGELVISERYSLQKLAKSLYKQQLEVLDAEAKTVLKEMIF